MNKNYSNFYKNIINKEKKSINAMLDTLPLEVINKAINLIIERKGDIVITGLGKSGLICKKLAATFSSLGTKAVFMHAAEALHGDLGMIDVQDLIIAVSHSGETDEILRMLSFAKQNLNKVIYIGGNKNSTLAKCSDISIIYDVDEEACFLNLAPTTSTTAQLIIGDAIAITLAYAQDFRKDDFSRFHPAGSLGKRLLLKIKDIMINDAVILKMNDTLYDAIVNMTSKRTGISIIVDDKMSTYGVLTDGDLRRILLTNSQNIKNILVSTICTKNPHVINLEENLESALKILRQNQITSLVVCDHNNIPIGAISLHEIENIV